VLHDRFDGLASLGEVDQQVAAWRDAPAAVVLLDLAFDAVNAGHDGQFVRNGNVLPGLPGR
jgi:hypothetical protein